LQQEVCAPGLWLPFQPQSKKKKPRAKQVRGAFENSSGLFSSFLRGASHLLNRHVLILKRADKTKKPCAKLAQGLKTFLTV
jgi:hypothetical protein